jgi:asparagine synthase (glutamine-hydrolysing)
LQLKLADTGDAGKLILKDVLDRHVPRQLMNRPKMGFGIPLGKWLRQELRPWAESMLVCKRTQ